MTTSLTGLAIVLASILWLAACNRVPNTGGMAELPSTAPPVEAPRPAPPPPAVEAPRPAPPPPAAVLPPVDGRPPPAATNGAPAPPTGRPTAGREPTGSGRPPAGGAGCPAAALAPFPWPEPPRPSVVATIAPYLLFGVGGRPASATLADVAARLEGAIARAGYLQPVYLGAGCDGFAIVLDLERIEADGTRAPGAQGFAAPGQETFSLAGYLARLFYAPPGYYRQIVIVVSGEHMRDTAPPPTEAQLRAIAREGRSMLPPGLAAAPYAPAHVVLALVYEFAKGPRDGDARLIPPQGRLAAGVHLKRSQLF